MSKSARAREAIRILSNDGARGFAQRVSRVAYQRLGAAELDFPLLLDDVADSRRLNLVTPSVRPTRWHPADRRLDLHPARAPAPVATPPCSA